MRSSSRMRILKSFRASLIVAIACVLAPTSNAQELPPRLLIGASAGGTLQNALATGLAKVASDATTTTVVVQPFSGTSAFFPLVDTGELDFGLASAVDFAMSYRGIDRLQVNGENPYPLAENLRLVMGGSPLIVGFVVRADSGIETVSDLSGRRVAGEFPAHLGARYFNYSALTAAGMTDGDVQIVPFSGIADGLAALVQDRVEAAAFGVGGPQVREADAAVGVRFISSDCSEEGRQKTQEAVPGHYLIDLASGSYAGVNTDICTVAFQNYLVTHAALESAAVTALLEATWNNIEQLATMHPSLSMWTREAMLPSDPTLPFHPAAIEFYKSVGAWTDDLADKQAALLAIIAD